MMSMPDEDHIVLIAQVQKDGHIRSCWVRVSTMLLEAGAGERGNSVNDQIMNQVREAIANIPSRFGVPMPGGVLAGFEESEQVAESLTRGKSTWFTATQGEIAKGLGIGPGVFLTEVR